MLIFLIPILFNMFLNAQLTHCHWPLPHSHHHTENAPAAVTYTQEKKKGKRKSYELASGLRR